MVSLCTVWYNDVRINKAVKMSPAMVAGISNALWIMGDIVTLSMRWPRRLSRGLYKKRDDHEETSSGA